jgi:hypothetical protein
VADQTSKLEKLEIKLGRQMAKANRTRAKLEKARTKQQVNGANGSLSNTTPS